MADWTKLLLIDAVEERENANGLAAVGRFYVPRADLAAVPVRGDSADGINPLWVVDEVIKSPVSATQYIVAISAVPRLTVGGVSWTGSLLGEYTVRYEYGEFIVTASMLGIEPYQSGESDGPIDDGHSYMPAMRHLDGSRYTVEEWEAATPDKCPFAVRPHHSYLDGRFSTLVAIVTFHSTKRAAALFPAEGWVGVNSRHWTTAAAAIPARYGIPNDSDQGYWRVAGGGGQEVEPVTDQSTGDRYWRITRRLERVPTLVYDCLSYVAGVKSGALKSPPSGTNVVWNPETNGGEMHW